MPEPLNNRAWSVALVGRTGARAAVRRWITEASEGELRLVTVSGPAGIGKSRILAWAADDQRRRSGLVWSGRCSPGLSPPFAPIATALGNHWPAPDSGVDDIDVSRHLAGSFEVPELRQVRALADVVAHEAAARPVLLVLDDLHWADPGTLGMLEQLVYVLAARPPQGCRVTVLLGHRPPDAGSHVDGVLARLAREPAFRSLSLDPLDEIEIQELIRRLTSTSPDRRLVQRVYEASGGNPLVAIAAADAASSSRHPRRPLGRTVDDVMARCLAGLAPPAVRVSLTLAVNAEPVRLADLTAMAGIPGAEWGAGLDELERLHLVDLDDVDEDRAGLASPHVTEAVLATATTAERQAAHARVAEHLRSASEVDVLALAHHLDRAGPRGAAQLGEVALDAAERAFAMGAWGWAGRLYEIAIDDAEPSDPLAQAALEEKAGIACFRDFDRPRCEQHLTAAIRLFSAHGELAEVARAATWLLRRRFTSGTEAIGRWIDVSALEPVIASRDLPKHIRAQAHGLLAEIAFQANDLAPARDHAAQAKALAAEGGDDLVAFWVAFSDGLAHLGVHDLDAAAQAFGEADQHVQRSGQHFFRSLGATRLALTEIVRADLEAADRWAASGSADAQTAANWAEHALAETARAAVAGLQGRFDDQEDHGERARVSCGRSGNTFSPLLLHPVMAWGRAARGDSEGASSALDELDRAGGRSGRYRLALDLMTEDPELVRKELAHYDWRPYPAALTSYDAGAHAAQLELAVHAANHDAVRAGGALFEDLHRRGGRMILDWPSSVPRLIADAKLCLGQTDEAAAWIDRAEAVATAAGARVELARLSVLRARILLARGDDEAVRAGVERIDQATGAFDTLGLLRFAQQAQALFDLPPSVDGATRRLRPRAVLFTDIVDSTAWNVRLGDDHWLVLMAEHNRLTRAAVRHQRGVVVKTTGDGVCAWFPTSTDAVECAVNLQRAFDGFSDAHPETPIRIRCGIAVGDIFDFDGDLAGLAVTEAARVCAEASASEIVTSEDVRRTDSRSGRRYRSIGHHHLKGLPEPVPLFAVEA